MPESGVTRRDFVFGLSGIATAAWLAAHLPELRATATYAATVSAEEPWQFFTPAQASEFDAISAQIVPADETPGAREARVVRFVDRFVATVGRDWQRGLLDDFKLLGDALEKWQPGSGSFAALSDANQIAFLTELETSQPDAFDDFRELTMLGMFSNPVHGGNFNKVGWKLVGFEDRHSWAAPFGYYDRA